MTKQYATHAGRVPPGRGAMSTAVRALLLGCAAIVPLQIESQEPVTETGGVAAGEQVEERFDVWKYRVLGAVVLPAPAVERALYAYLGPQKTIAAVEVARKALEDSYRSAGYST